MDVRWFKQWKKYVGFDQWDTHNMGDQSVHPGAIDNSSLFKRNLFSYIYIYTYIILAFLYIIYLTEAVFMPWRNV